jgi:hypothetical protein
MGVPSASRAMRPSSGSAVPFQMPARASASVLTQASWPSRFWSRTGRSGTIRSRSSRRGVPPGKSERVQPPPRIQGLAAANAVELAADPRQAGHRRVDVRVLEPRRDGPPAQLDVAGSGTDATAHVPVAAHGDDPAVAHGQRLGPGPRGIGGEDATPGQDEIGVLLVRHGAESATGRWPVHLSSRSSGVAPASPAGIDLRSWWQGPCAVDINTTCDGPQRARIGRIHARRA